MKTLVVYYSRKGNTENIALAKAKELEADFLAIDTIENVAGYNGFKNCVKFAFSKKDMILFPYDTDIFSYEKVIICSPIWFSGLSTPMKTFIKKVRQRSKSFRFLYRERVIFLKHFHSFRNHFPRKLQKFSTRKQILSVQSAICLSMIIISVL